MNEKVLLILVDGMRPDAIPACRHPALADLCQSAAWTWTASTVAPSVTLPCHASLFLSVDPQRHGITTNTWIPQVRPIPSICDAAAAAGKICGMFYNWEPLRDLNLPGSLDASFFWKMGQQPAGCCDAAVTERAISYIRSADPDFVFLYLGEVDERGHRHGWMSPEYLESVSLACGCIQKAIASLPPGWNVIITADHGGHGRTHGTTLPEDMTIPLYLSGPGFPAGQLAGNPNIKDIAPTIAALMKFPVPRDWEGSCLL